MFYIYILYAKVADKFYVGYTRDVKKRLELHNLSGKNTFTSKYRPWKVAALFLCGKNEGEAIKAERFIKRQKSRSLLQKLVDPEFKPTGELAQLVRVPHVRD